MSLPPSILRPPTKTVAVACIDIGAKKGLGAAFGSYDLAGTWRKKKTPVVVGMDAAATRSDLAGHLASALSEQPVALGIEGPLWGAATGPFGEIIQRPFEPKSSGGGPFPWYSGAGAAAAIMASSLLVGLLAEVKQRFPGLQLTYGLAGHPSWKRGVLLLWEAFIPKPKCCTPTGDWTQDTQDAVCAIEHGFLNFNNTTTEKTKPLGGVVVPLAGRFLEADGFVGKSHGSGGWWRELGCVVRPQNTRGKAEQLWP